MNRIFVIICFSHRSFLKFLLEKKFHECSEYGKAFSRGTSLLSITLYTVERPFIAYEGDNS